MHPKGKIAEVLKEIEIDFVIEDLDKTLISMKYGTKCISYIVLSLRFFSRIDEAEFKPVNVHEGIESNLILLRNQTSIIQYFEQCYLDTLSNRSEQIESLCIRIQSMRISEDVAILNQRYQQRNRKLHSR